MNIGEFSKRTGISAHTLRYYEKIGLLQGVARNAGGNRTFTEQDVEWAEFVGRLKAMAMPLAQIKEYADLRAQGGRTARARMELLQAHADVLEQRIAEEKAHLARLHEKIEVYREVVGTEDR